MMRCRAAKAATLPAEEGGFALLPTATYHWTMGTSPCSNPPLNLPMNLKLALAVLAANEKIADGSFVQCARTQRRRFEPELFWTLYTAMTVVARTHAENSAERLVRRTCRPRPPFHPDAADLAPDPARRLPHPPPPRALAAGLSRPSRMIVLAGDRRRAGYGDSPDLATGSRSTAGALDRALPLRRSRKRVAIPSAAGSRVASTSRPFRPHLEAWHLRQLASRSAALFLKSSARTWRN